MEEADVVDMSEEFKTLDTFDFLDEVDRHRRAKEITITVDWTSKNAARRLKAFLESAEFPQKRFAAIKATVQQKMEELNVFGSGVKWIPVEEEK